MVLFDFSAFPVHRHQVCSIWASDKGLCLEIEKPISRNLEKKYWGTLLSEKGGDLNSKYFLLS